MRVSRNMAWVYCIGDDTYFDDDKSGKWMYFFDDAERAIDVCSDAVESGIVNEAKHSYADKGVACFYVNIDDADAHKRVIKFFLDNGLIPRTAGGRFEDIPFKLDSQTRAGEYGENFVPRLTLSDFIDLDTGEWTT